MEVISGKVKKPFNVIVYGPPGAGKSTWAKYAPKPIYVASDELDELDVARQKKVTTFEQVIKQLKEIVVDKHSYETVVVDTIDEIEKFVHQEIISGEKTAKTKFMNKACGGYGGAYEVALNKMTEIKALLIQCRKRGMNIVILCHSMTRVTNDPLLGDSYTEYYLAVHEKVQNMFINWVSCVLFLAFDVAKTDKEKFASGSGERYIYTQKKPGFESKNRYNLDPVIAAPVGDPFTPFFEGYNEYFEDVKPVANGEDKTSSVKRIKIKNGKLIASIEALMENVSNDKLEAKVADRLVKYKNDIIKLEQLKSKVESLIGG